MAWQTGVYWLLGLVSLPAGLWIAFGPGAALAGFGAICIVTGFFGEFDG